MARRPLPINTWGEIKTKPLRHKRYEAHARYRHDDGVTRQHRRTGRTAEDARDNLKTFFSELAGESLGEVTRDTRFKVICQAWIEELTAQYAMEGKSPNTPRTYRRAITNWIAPTLGELTAREITPRRCDALIQRAARERSANTASTIKTVLSNVSVYAIRHGAMTVNPTKNVGRIGNGQVKEPPRALTLEERLDLLEKLDAAAVGSGSAVQRLLPDMSRMMLATGVRISEVLALSGDDVDLEERAVTVGHHLVQPDGGGVRRMEGRKGGGRPLKLGMTEWSVEMWETRKLASGGGPLLSIHNGLWVRPKTAGERMSEVMESIGYGWVTSHVWRKTVATVLRESGLTSDEAADQLGHTAAVLEAHYRAPRVVNPKAVDALNGALTKRAVSVRSDD